jgi:PIN domain nuclease of toxin-antitoxin system
VTERPILLDTHAVLWVARGELTSDAVGLLDAAFDAGVPVVVSPISAWEVGMLVARGRVALPLLPLAWFEETVSEGLSWAPLTPQVLVDASFLPGRIHGDPADRILVATARAFGYRLMTRDKALLTYAEAGHIQALAC